MTSSNYNPIQWLNIDFIKPKMLEECTLYGTAKNSNGIGPETIKESVKIINKCPEAQCVLISKNNKSAEWIPLKHLFNSNELSMAKCQYFYDYFNSIHIINSMKYIKTCSFTIKDLKEGTYRFGFQYLWKGYFSCKFVLDNKYIIHEYVGINKETDLWLNASGFNIIKTPNFLKKCNIDVIIECLNETSYCGIKNIVIEIEQIDNSVKSLPLLPQFNIDIRNFIKGNSYTYELPLINIKKLIDNIQEINKKVEFISILDNTLYIEFVFPLTKQEKGILDIIIQKNN